VAARACAESSRTVLSIAGVSRLQIAFYESGLDGKGMQARVDDSPASDSPPVNFENEDFTWCSLLSA
jgi:hypothetical protein